MKSAAATSELAAKPQTVKLPSVKRLLAATIKTYARGWRVYTAITAIIAVPYGVMTAAAGGSGDQNVAALAVYGSFASLIMNLALLSAIISHQSGRLVKPKAAYYYGTAPLVRFVLVSLVLVLQLVPFLIGAVLFTAAAFSATMAVENALVGLLWLVLSLPSGYWLTRYIFSLLIVCQSSHTPLEALRASRQAVTGRGLPVFGRLAVIGLAVLALTLVPTALVTVIFSGSGAQAAMAVLQLIVNLVLIPLTYIYAHKLYLAL